MPRFYFDLQDGEACVIDEEGVELTNIVSAQLEAAQSLVDMVKGLHPTDRDAAGMWIECRDTEGPLFSVRFSFLDRRKH